ncbi:COG2958 family protein [Endozoicomonas euniceicola]|uniref:HrgA protein n=1 Tax=Endozoicomonas euniceicola TaxID=1234143 RepID=A0ABY6GTR6_9GAMM|nr:hypothetical protein [Endozoicomonas euniceicola]UYM16177.1 hypothetical protein NX720_25840 [Endozoicomonas euniceicola]
MTLKLTKTVTEFLKGKPDQPHTARQIAEWIYQNKPAECAAKKAKSQSATSDQELITQIVAEIGSQYPRLKQRVPQIKTTQGKPRKYYFTEKSDDVEISEAESVTSASGSEASLNEHQLYPLLSDYLWSQHHLYSKRIDEKKSSNKKGTNGNKWLYPDIVAMENLSHDWHPEVRDCVGVYGDSRTRLWSFEVKLKLNTSNVRQSFFQAVSNSSWANAGYLVAADIIGDDTLKELRMLYALHGIGLIRLDVENPADSEILIPARERSDVDWNTCSRLASENKDFLDYIRLIRQFHQTGDIHKKYWDIFS